MLVFQPQIILVVYIGMIMTFVIFEIEIIVVTGMDIIEIGSVVEIDISQCGDNHSTIIQIHNLLGTVVKQSIGSIQCMKFLFSFHIITKSE
jgi:hypothetical protein